MSSPALHKNSFGAWSWTSITNGRSWQFRFDPKPHLKSINGNKSLGAEHHWDPKTPDSLPLIEVKELDSLYRETGQHLVETKGLGLIEYKHPHAQKCILDHRNYQRPVIQENSLDI